ncbi:MAG TPA: SH3-like domain-containing protein [Thermoleophilaceae bacterium]|nr:SH3-like domain-containing protein [Thermoleophilaceae bacterium]
MPSADRADRISSLDLVGQLRPAFHEVQDWTTPDQIDSARFRGYMKTSHDVGGEPAAPAEFFLKEEEQWELNTYVTCEVLGWRGIWTSEERRRIDNVDIGKTMYHGLPYYGRWIWSAARVLVEKHHITLGELIERVGEVRRRYPDAIGAELPDAAPRAAGDPAAANRNEHHLTAVGKGDPQCYAGLAAEPGFSVGDRVRVRDLPTVFYTRTQEYVRGVHGTIVGASYESLAPEDEAFDRHDQRPEWFYIVRFRMTDLWEPYAGTASDTLQTELPERWLEAVGAEES